MQGLLGVCPGEERHLVVPAALAYGDRYLVPTIRLFCKTGTQNPTDIQGVISFGNLCSDAFSENALKT